MKIKTSIILIFFLISFCFNLLASEEESLPNTKHEIDTVELEEKQIESMVDTMVTAGRMSDKEASEIKRSIASVKKEGP